MEKLDLTNTNLRKFGMTMGVVCLIMTIFLKLGHRHSLLPLASLSVLFFLSAFVIPVILKPLYILWMRLAFILSWINTRLILIFIFYLVFAPIGIFIKLCRKDLLEIKIEKLKGSYWKQKEKPVLKNTDYERQF